MLTPSQIAAKWARNTAGSTESVKAGVMAVTQSPMEKAAQNLDKAAMNYQAAVSSGRMGKALRAVSLADWQQAMIEKGVQRIASGTQRAVPKMEAFMAAWMPVMERVKNQVATMPSGTTEAALDRVRVVIEAGKKFAGKL